MDDVHFPSTHCIDSLLKAGMNPQDKDEDGRTALHIIVSNKKVKWVIYLLCADDVIIVILV